MKPAKFIYLVISFLLLAQISYSQNKEEVFEKYRALLKSGENVVIEQGQLTSSGLLDATNPQNKIVIPLSDIRALDRYSGTKALEYGLYGAGCGLLGSLLGIAQVQADPNKKLKDNAATIVIAITAVCGVIGALIGMGNEKWEQVPLNNQNSFRLDQYQTLIAVQIKL